MSKQKICLTMIVKNEEKVIERCLFSCLKLIDYFVICDTGSTDRTIEVIKEFSKKHNLLGEVHEHKWKNFEYNRNLSLEIAKKKGDYIYWMDADDILEYEPNWVKPVLTHEAYIINIRYTPVHYKRIHLVKSTAPMKWTGVLHETLEVENASAVQLDGVTMVIVGGGGGRNLDPLKHQKDAVILENALKDEPENTRYMFYLAQSYRNYGNHTKAIEWYGKRSTYEHFPEERCYAKYQVGVLKLIEYEKNKKYSESEAIMDLLQAYNYFPLRLEPLYVAVLTLNKNKMFNVSYNLGIKAISQRKPDESCILFTEQDVYDFKLPFELAYSAFSIGKYLEALIIYLCLFMYSKNSQEHKNLIQNNIQVCMSKLNIPNIQLNKKIIVELVNKTQENSLRELLYFVDK